MCNGFITNICNKYFINFSVFISHLTNSDKTHIKKSSLGFLITFKRIQGCWFESLKFETHHHMRWNHGERFYCEPAQEPVHSSGNKVQVRPRGLGKTDQSGSGSQDEQILKWKMMMAWTKTEATGRERKRWIQKMLRRQNWQNLATNFGIRKSPGCHLQG